MDTDFIFIYLEFRFYCSLFAWTCPVCRRVLLFWVRNSWLVWFADRRVELVSVIHHWIYDGVPFYHPMLLYSTCYVQRCCFVDFGEYFWLAIGFLRCDCRSIRGILCFSQCHFKDSAYSSFCLGLFYLLFLTIEWQLIVLPLY